MIVVLRHLSEIFNTNKPVILGFFSGVFLKLLVESFSGPANVQVLIVLGLGLLVWLSIIAVSHRYTKAVARIDPDWAKALEEFLSTVTTIIVFIVTSYTLQILNDARNSNRLSVAELIVYSALLLLAITTLSILVNEMVRNQNELHQILRDRKAAAPKNVGRRANSVRLFYSRAALHGLV